MEESLMNRTAPAFRIPYLDNAKFLLIALVAAGHFVQPIKSTRFSYNIYFFIAWCNPIKNINILKK